MKKLLAYGVLVVFLFNSMGYFVIYEVNRYLIRKEMQTAISRSPVITVIEVPASGTGNPVTWINKREFIYQGSMYDVIYTSVRSTKTLYYCIHDKKEENLVKSFQRANTSRISQALWNLMVHFAVPTASFTLKTEDPLPVSYPFINNKMCSVTLTPVSPPPRYQS